MKTFLFIFIFSLLIISLQIALAPLFNFIPPAGGIILDLTLIGFILFLFLAPLTISFWLAVFLGFLIDLLSPLRFGLFLFSYLGLFIFYYFARRKLEINFFAAPFVFFTASFLFFGWQAIIAQANLIVILASVVYNTIIGFLLFVILRLIIRSANHPPII